MRTSVTRSLSNYTRKAYYLRAVGVESSCKSSTDTGHEIHADLPKLQGGRDTAPQPVELLLASLVSCKQATAQFVARHMKPRVRFTGIEFDIHAERDQTGAIALPLEAIHDNTLVPSRLHTITGTVKVYSVEDQQLTDAQLRELERQVQKRCPVANMIHASGCQMKLTWSAHPEKDWKGGARSGKIGPPGSTVRGNRNESILSRGKPPHRIAQQMRAFSSSVSAPSSSSEVNCWVCGEPLLPQQSGDGSGYVLFCTARAHGGDRVLQPLRKQKMDYFALFELNKNAYQLDMDALEIKFKNMQRLCHPDLYAASSVRNPTGVHDESEQLISSENSSLINQAYQVLRLPVERAAYILQTCYDSNVLAEDSGTYTDATLAMEIFELRETLEDLLQNQDKDKKKTELSAFHQQMKQRQEDLMQQFHDLHKRDLGKEKEREKHVDSLNLTAVRLKYITKIVHEIECA